MTGMPPPRRTGLALAQLVAPASVDDFRKCWPNRAFFTAGRDRHLPGITDAPELTDVRAILTHAERFPEGRVRAWFNRGDGVLRQLRRLDPPDALTLYGTGEATIVVDRVDQMIPRLAAYMWSLQQDLGIPRSRIGCNLYASRSGAGSVMHFDEQENFFLHLRGVKRWRLHQNRQVAYPSVSYFGGPLPEALRCLTDRLPRQMPAEAELYSLERGSVLFVPRGCWHESSTLEDSLALTLTINTTTWTGALLEILERHLNLEESWRAPIGLDDRAGTGARDLAERAQDRLQALAEMVRSPDVASDWLDLLHGRDRLVVRKGMTWRLTEKGLLVTPPLEEGAGQPTDLCVSPAFVRLLRWMDEQEGPFVWAEGLAAAGLNHDLASEKVRRTLMSAGVLDPAWHR